MENASKALIIAGSVLVSMIVLSLLVMFFNNLRSVVGTQQAVEGEVAAAEFNKQFDVYARDLYGTELFSLANKIVNYNKSNDVKNGYETINLKVILDNNLDDTLANGDKLFLQDKAGYSAEKFLNDYNSLIKIVEDKTKPYKLTNKSYTTKSNNNRTVEQLASMRTNELKTYGFTKEGMQGNDYDNMQNDISKYKAYKSVLNTIKQIKFTYIDSSYYDKTTGRIKEMTFKWSK